MLCTIHRATNTSKVIDNIAKRYGHEVLRLPPFHCDLNAIEPMKNYFASEMCKKCVEHVEHVELSYWKTDRIIDLKMDQLEISLDANEDESDIELDSDQEDF